jgi:hypothetical protein
MRRPMSRLEVWVSGWMPFLSVLSSFLPFFSSLPLGFCVHCHDAIYEGSLGHASLSCYAPASSDGRCKNLLFAIPDLLSFLFG